MAIAHAVFDIRWVNPFPLPVLAGFALLAGVRPGWHRDETVRRGSSILAFVLGGYVLVYLTTPLDLRTQLDTSLKRLLLQLWPMALLVYFMVVRDPTDATIDVRRRCP